MSKFKPGDVVQVLNTRGFYCDMIGKPNLNLDDESDGVVKSFLYSIGVVEGNYKTHPQIGVTITMGQLDPIEWYFHPSNLKKIGVL